MEAENFTVCPCTLSDTPCNPNCTCKNSILSGGCFCCATYGNEEQKRAMANHVVKAVKDYIEVEAYKSQLKKLIEERLNWFENVCDPIYTGRQFKIAELKCILELIDQVKPPQP